MVKQGIVSTISPRHVGRLLAKQISNRTSPVLVKSPTRSLMKSQDICDTYLSAISAPSGERTISIDEMTGIQARCASSQRPTDAPR